MPKSRSRLIWVRVLAGMPNKNLIEKEIYMIYKCICGKEFDNSQKINAHKKHCLVYLGKDIHSEEYINQMRRMSKIANEHKTQKTKERKEKELQQ